MLLSPQNVIEEFGRLTGLRFRPGLIPYDVGRQAVVFAKHFQLWELKLVVEWTRAMVRISEGGERNGFSKQSLQWHCMIAEGGDETLTRFQQRLGLANEWAKRNRPDLLPRTEKKTTVQRTQVRVGEEADAHVWTWHAFNLRQMKHEIAPPGPPKLKHGEITPCDRADWAERKRRAAEFLSHENQTKSSTREPQPDDCLKLHPSEPNQQSPGQVENPAS